MVLTTVDFSNCLLRKLNTVLLANTTVNIFYCINIPHISFSPLNVTSSNPSVSSAAEVSSLLLAAFIEPLAMNAGTCKV